MTDAACPTTCNASACCCDARLKSLEKRVCRIRTWLFIALGVLILLVGIAIGKGGERREEMRERVAGFVQRRAMMPRGGMPGMGPGPMPGRMGPGPGADRGPGGDDDDHDSDRGPRGRRGSKDKDD